MEQLYLPNDSTDSRFTTSFTAESDCEEMKSFFDEYGVIVVRDVLTQTQAQNTFQEIIQLMENESPFRYENPETWHHWPSQGIERYGQVQREPYFLPTFLQNRQNEKMLKVFSILYGVNPEELIVNHDRGCLFRPGAFNPKFKTQKNVHLDLDPWGFLSNQNEGKVKKNLAQLRYGKKLNEFIFENNQVHSSMYNSLHLQAGINLLDNEFVDGGFLCVPGFANYFTQWVQENRNSSFVETSAERNSVQFPKSHCITGQAQRITMRAGSLVIWDQRTPHGSAPTEGNQFRSAQFLKVFPKTELHAQPQRRKARRATLLRKIRETNHFEVSELGKHVFDL